jgi:hypothetical protein
MRSSIVSLRADFAFLAMSHNGPAADYKAATKMRRLTSRHEEAAVET